jgi:hypothetical protein
LRIATIADAIGIHFNLAAHDRFFMQQGGSRPRHRRSRDEP